MNNEILIYQTEGKAVEVRLDSDQETIWLTQKQIAGLFSTTSENILMHLKNVYTDGELPKNSTTKNFLVVQSEGKRQVKRQLKHYNLDAIISVGYRVNSKKGTQFRIWATQRLREYLVRGYSLNEQRLEHNAAELEAALQLVRKAAQSPELQTQEGRGLVEILSRYAQTFLLLQRYDEGLLSEPATQDGGILPDIDNARSTLAELKQKLIANGEATELFAQERNEGLASILGNLDQSIFGEAAYPSIESKAAHLLYFVIKNHPFADGNKRSGAFLFVDFLNQNARLLNNIGEPVINDIGLAALTLLVAESKPENKDTMIRLIMNMLAQ